MRAWEIRKLGPIETNPLHLITREDPQPDKGEIRVKVSTCGVCRTDLHLAEGDLAPKRAGVIPGHEIVGTVDRLGEGARRFAVGERVGIAWLRYTCGRCRFCKRGDENLCPRARFTGWDEDGGYAEYAVVREDYAYRLSQTFDDEHVAPLLCSGIIGYRALRRSALPPGGRLGIYGFGGSAHIAAQVAIYEGARVHVMTRSERARNFALELGVATANESHEPPEQLDSAILFAPAGDLVPLALRHLDRGGTLAIAGIHLTELGRLDYVDHLFYERKIVTVTANTRRDGEEFLEVAATIPVKVSVTEFDLRDADVALKALARGDLNGAAVLDAGSGKS
jgi:propanol-preferring alcohol dehydrogenase